MKVNKNDGKVYHEQHFLIDKDLHNEFKEVVSNYNNFGNSFYKNKSFDKTTLSELIRMMIHSLVSEYDNTSDGNFQLMEKLSDFRNAGAGAKQ